MIFQRIFDLRKIYSFKYIKSGCKDKKIKTSFFIKKKKVLLGSQAKPFFLIKDVLKKKEPTSIVLCQIAIRKLGFILFT